MNNKLFLDYNLSLEMKEIGFDEPCLAWFTNDTFTVWGAWKAMEYSKTGFSTYKNSEQVAIAAPLYQQAIDFFREKHGIHIDISAYYNPQKIDKFFYEIGLSTKDNGFEGLLVNASKRLNEDWIKNPEQFNLSPDYYSALTQAIKESINIVKNQKK